MRGDSEKKLAAELELLKTWLKRSRDCPLSLSLTHVRNVTHRLVPQFLRAIVTHRQRWEHVDILMPFEHMHLIQGDMPLLRNLTFGPSNFPHGRARFPHLFHGAPQLKRAILTRNYLNEEGGNVTYAMNSIPDIPEAAATLRKSEERGPVQTPRPCPTWVTVVGRFQSGRIASSRVGSRPVGSYRVQSGRIGSRAVPRRYGRRYVLLNWAVAAFKSGFLRDTVYRLRLLTSPSLDHQWSLVGDHSICKSHQLPHTRREPGLWHPQSHLFSIRRCGDAVGLPVQ
ncbi:hypothetical protein K438DRAFT_1847756 [Mycena galopus ATCC 62051]|nr:hypothetical protein K438DRAFT_1847756 [Mycena galopus ATCC 62051]